MTEACVVRSYDPHDEPVVIALWQTVFPDEPAWNEPAEVMRRKLTVQQELLLVCCSGDRFAGTVFAGFAGVRGWVHKRAVYPAFEGTGMASRLMEAAEAALSSMGCPKLNLHVRSANAPVVTCDENAGYASEDRMRMGKRRAPEDEVAKRLGPGLAW